MNPRLVFDSTILITALVYGLLIRFSVAGGLFGLYMLILLLLSLSRYAYTVLRDVALKRRLRALSIETMLSLDDIGLVLHSALFFLAAYVLLTTPLLDGLFGMLIRWTLFFGVLAIFPASTARIAVTGNLGDSFSLSGIINIISIMGGRYWRLLFACGTLGLLFVVNSKTTLAHGVLFFLITDCIAVWIFLMLFALIGEAIGDFRTELDLRGEPEIRLEQNKYYRERERQKYLDRAYSSLSSGLKRQGLRSIKTLITEENNSLEIFEWLFDQTITWDNSSYAMVIAEWWIERLIEEGQKGTAIDLVQRCQRQFPDFAPSPESLTELINFAHSNGWYRIAEDLEVYQKGNQNSENN